MATNFTSLRNSRKSLLAKLADLQRDRGTRHSAAGPGTGTGRTARPGHRPQWRSRRRQDTAGPCRRRRTRRLASRCQQPDVCAAAALPGASGRPPR